MLSYRLENRISEEIHRENATVNSLKLTGSLRNKEDMQIPKTIRSSNLKDLLLLLLF